MCSQDLRRLALAYDLLPKTAPAGAAKMPANAVSEDEALTPRPAPAKVRVPQEAA